MLLGTVSVVGNFFIVLFLGLAFAAQPAHLPRRIAVHCTGQIPRAATLIVDRIGETLERWLIAQIITMIAVFLVTWIGLAIIGIPGSFILGIQAGLLAFIPTVGAIFAGLIVVLASLASGWIAALSAFLLFLGVHAMESYVLTPIIQRQALDIPPATLFAFQILLGVVFGIWGLALALPLMAIAKVMIDHFKAEDQAPGRAPEYSPSGGQDGLGVLDLGRGGKIGTDQRAPGGEILGAAEIDGVVLQRLPFGHEAIALRLLDRLVQFEAVKALGAAESGLGLGDGRLEILLAARLDVDLCDLGDHRFPPLCCLMARIYRSRGKRKRRPNGALLGRKRGAIRRTA